MNGKKSKQIRKIVKPQDPITRRVYRRAKKQYNKTPRSLRAEYISELSFLLDLDAQTKPLD